MKEFFESRKPKNVEEAVECFQNNDNQSAIQYLRENKNEIGEFCIQIKECYPENDTTTPFLRIAELIENLL